MATLGFRNFLGDTDCKTVVYLRRWPGASPSAPAVTSRWPRPSHPRWTLQVKEAQAQVCVAHPPLVLCYSHILFFWGFSSLLGMNLFYFVTNTQDKLGFLYQKDRQWNGFFSRSWSRRTLFQGVMGGSSGCTISFSTGTTCVFSTHRAASCSTKPTLRSNYKACSSSDALFSSVG